MLTLAEGNDDRILAGEVLIQGANADTRALRDEIGIQAVQSFAFEHTRRCLQNCSHGLFGAGLLGNLARL